MGPEKTEELLRGWTPMSCKGQVQQIKVGLKTKACCQRTRRRSRPRKGQQPSEAPQASTSAKKRTSKPQREIRRESENLSGTSLTHQITESPRRRRQPWTMCSRWKEL
ncbi:hypothetical protein O181_080647 [Austropuccinia psidii MF-1]|uniref:Uncharacterized protein n=1 Tax=Austropuccinia psidii MF-1 TaxID=1389203 RepID=A0A9Q3FP97_9BASI|nr:hypothetical protein [Austropuccinia psidii MF-1]